MSIEVINELKRIEQQAAEQLSKVPGLARIAAPDLFLGANTLIGDITALRIRLQREAQQGAENA